MRALPAAAPSRRDLGRGSRTVVVLKLRRTPAFMRYRFPNMVNMKVRPAAATFSDMAQIISVHSRSLRRAVLPAVGLHLAGHDHLLPHRPRLLPPGARRAARGARIRADQSESTRPSRRIRVVPSEARRPNRIIRSIRVSSFKSPKPSRLVRVISSESPMPSRLVGLLASCVARAAANGSGNGFL